MVHYHFLAAVDRVPYLPGHCPCKDFTTLMIKKIISDIKFVARITLIFLVVFACFKFILWLLQIII
jgi:hypothetical protein